MLYFVVKTHSQPILGLKACEEMNLIHRVQTLQSQEDVFEQYSDVFNSSALGCLPVSHHIQLNKDHKPVIHPPRRVSASLRPKVKVELDRMQKLGVITPVKEPTQWVSSLVTIVKPDKIRLCIDPRELNKAIEREFHPMKTVEEVVARIPNAHVFSTLDATSGFWQIPLDEESSMLTCFNTPFGRYKFNRLPFGISSAPEVYQRTMEEIFQDIQGCEVIVDDLLVWGTTEEEHDQNLIKVLERAREVNLKLNKKKTRIRVKEVTYIGHTLTADGLKPDTKKVEAIVKMPTPQSKEELQRFLGMIQYLAKFIPELSEKASPLRELLKKNSTWSWYPEHQAAFDKLKEECSRQPTLKYYDVNKPVKISADSSQSGLGAVCLQDDQPIAYGSRALTDTQRGYAQIEKELLAIVFACQKFHDYIYGKKVQVETDHKPLVNIFMKPLNECPMRLQRMLIKLQQYDLEVHYKPGKELWIADQLSRAYQQNSNEDDLEEELEIQIVLPISTPKLNQLKEDTKNDGTLQRLKEVVLQGWPKYKSDLHPSIRAFWDFQEELTVCDDIIFKGEKIVIPEATKPAMLAAIHQPHLGIESSKRRARELLYWQGMDADIEKLVRACSVCNRNKPQQQREPLKPHPSADRPWQRIGSDILTFCQRNYLITADFYSGWYELDFLNSLTSSAVIVKLKAHMARYGIPDVLFTDNGTQYDSEEFRQFSKKWNFVHKTSSPRYPQSNGAIERAVQSAKALLLKALEQGEDPYLSLLNSRNTPRDEVLGSPSQRLMSRRTKTLIPATEEQLKPQVKDPQVIKERLDFYKKQQKKTYDKNAKQLPPLITGDTVRIRDDKGFHKKGTVVRDTEYPRSYIVRSQGVEYRRNRKHLLKVGEPNAEQPVEDEAVKDQVDACTGAKQNTESSTVINQEQAVKFTRSGRHVKPPDRLDL